MPNFVGSNTFPAGAYFSGLFRKLMLLRKISGNLSCREKNRAWTPLFLQIYQKRNENSIILITIERPSEPGKAQTGASFFF